MWIVRVALNRPYSFIVGALLQAILGPLTIFATPTDVFANIKAWTANRADAFLAIEVYLVVATIMGPLTRKAKVPLVRAAGCAH